MKINEKIKLLRENHHWSQEELAQKLNMSKNGYAKIERGETRPSLQRLEQIATVLDMDICELLSFGDSQTVSYSGNHLNCSNIIVGDANQEFLLQHYQQIIALKDEVIANKDNIIAALRREIELLNDKIQSS